MIHSIRDDELKTDALVRAREHADPRVVEVLERAHVVIDHDARAWDGSSGSVRAHVVRLGLDARDLALLHRAPSVRDSLCAIVATVISNHAGESMADLACEWTRTSDGPQHAYRGHSPGEIDQNDPAQVRDGLAIYLREIGEVTLANVIVASHIELIDRRRKRVVKVHGPRELIDNVKRDPMRVAVLHSAVTALLARSGAHPVEIELTAD